MFKVILTAGTLAAEAAKVKLIFSSACFHRHREADDNAPSDPLSPFVPHGERAREGGVSEKCAIKRNLLSPALSSLLRREERECHSHAQPV
jgi:hypothetical protein